MHPRAADEEHEIKQHRQDQHGAEIRLEQKHQSKSPADDEMRQDADGKRANQLLFFRHGMGQIED